MNEREKKKKKKMSRTSKEANGSFIIILFGFCLPGKKSPRTFACTNIKMTYPSHDYRATDLLNLN